ncbi:MAG: UPF0175 family protein [Kiritimatiellae bacterium]|nr:UPF0175 family protein [Kiritimatiellia bacterium]
MKTVTLSTRLTREEARRIDSLAARAGQERSAVLKRIIRRGLADLQLEEACAAYRQRRISLSRAAELAGLSLRDLLLRLPDAAVELNYGEDDLKQDLAAEV